ncbi:hypothetical protein CEXT_90381 [Caerostris extrusa]|uniref:Uncharacterized protein n=1 Tax=Caerostris extrusa TaxID=172846 RepID=A0AAV4Y4E3_CAEEX|nr:hypothetical protein CEXT_90381 [Caerostris extrusa]
MSAALRGCLNAPFHSQRGRLRRSGFWFINPCMCLSNTRGIGIAGLIHNAFDDPWCPPCHVIQFSSYDMPGRMTYAFACRACCCPIERNVFVFN